MGRRGVWGEGGLAGFDGKKGKAGWVVKAHPPRRGDGAPHPPLFVSSPSWHGKLIFLKEGKSIPRSKIQKKIGNISALHKIIQKNNLIERE